MCAAPKIRPEIRDTPIEPLSTDLALSLGTPDSHIHSQAQVSCRQICLLRCPKLRWTSMTFPMNEEDFFLSAEWRSLAFQWSTAVRRNKLTILVVLLDWHEDQRNRFGLNVHRLNPLIMSGTKIQHSLSVLFIYWEIDKRLRFCRIQPLRQKGDCSLLDI